MNYILILVSLAVFFLFLHFFVVNCDSVKEGWVNYNEDIYNNIEIGSGSMYSGDRPVVFYEREIFRRPYNWPVCHLVDYPVPHCRSDSI